MGIDKKNIRYTINYGIPASIEALAQESGRAGRDRKSSICAIVYTPETSKTALDFLNQDLDAEVAYSRIKGWQYQSDVSRLAFFHHLSYRDRARDIDLLRDVAAVVRSEWEYSNLQVGELLNCSIPFASGDEETTSIEKAIYRLSVSAWLLITPRTFLLACLI